MLMSFCRSATSVKRDALLTKLALMLDNANRDKIFSALVLLTMENVTFQEAVRARIGKHVRNIASESSLARSVHSAASHFLGQQLMKAWTQQADQARGSQQP